MIYVSVDDLIIDPKLSCRDLDLEPLIASLNQIGLINPIQVRVTGDRYTVIVGLLRVLAFKKLGWCKIAAEVIS